jgi:hypothetical protein
VIEGTPPGRLDPRSLSAARVELHHAALLVSGVGRCLARWQPGYRHAALSWDAVLGGLAGWPVESPSGGEVRAALTFEPPRLLLLDSRDGPQRVPIELTGRRFAEVQERLTAALADAGLHADAYTVRIPADLPHGPIQRGVAFAPDVAAAGELGHWFAFAHARLAGTTAALRAGTGVPCWPDHLDMAVAVTMEPGTGQDRSPAGTVTLGFSAGDATIAEPYFYVTAWPPPPPGAPLPAAPSGGRWHLEGWTGLALDATSILQAGDPPGLAAAFLERGDAICRHLLGAA